ncbi:MAG: DNA gyrase inhibitor YacG [Leptothrix sp. (in: Bacteria)]|nr:DNA gyrase inhibitor YacG [Leptothrix sp. (in: b-proteobacteria)]
MKAPEVRTVPCPACQRPALYAERNRWRPFCSERCRTADLGAWASEKFRLPADAARGDDESPRDAH